jgi:phosphatidyl-myo-inositol dimannoside synthase
MVDYRDVQVIVSTSSLPRWEGDSTPRFVLDHGLLLAEKLQSVAILAPHAKGAKKTEQVADNAIIRRIRYAWPASQQTLFLRRWGSKQD